MVERVEQRFDLKPKHLIGDTAYGTASMLGWMVEDKQIEPHVPVWDKSERTDGTLSRSDFTWHADADEYHCPMGKPLRSSGKATADGTMIYRSSVHDCVQCELKSRCCPNTPQRKITRQRHEAARDVARQVATTTRYERSRRHRKKVEMLFAHLKRILRLDRLRLRGLSGAHDEFLLAATAQNLRRMAKWLMPKAPEAVPMWSPHDRARAFACRFFTWEPTNSSSDRRATGEMTTFSTPSTHSGHDCRNMFGGFRGTKCTLM